MPVRIIIADDHPIVRQGVIEIIKEDKDYKITGEFADGQLLLQSPELHQADILLLDLNMPRTDGLQVLESIQKINNDIKIIVLTSYASEKLAQECKQLGASAYIVKTQNLTVLPEVIRSVINGGTFFDEIREQGQDSGQKFSYLDSFLVKYKITKREAEIIKLICKGHTSNEIAEKLIISLFTVQTHRKNIFRKLQLDNSNPATLYEFAVENGLI